jgi:hypothetical protein
MSIHRVVMATVIALREPTGWFFDAATIPGGDVLGQLLEVRGQDVLTRRTGPHLRRLRGARAKEDGTFVVDGLPVGSYRLATLLDAVRQ